jgi:hypothetical protein
MSNITAQRPDRVVHPRPSVDYCEWVRTLTAAATAALVCFILGACGSSGTAPAGTVAARSTEVSFVTDGTTTYGTLDVPAHRANQHLAAALLLAGSGPTDRNGNQEPSMTPNTLGQIAATLDKMGIMSLRFDKYFAGKTGVGSRASDPGSLDLNAFIRQADAAYQLLSSQSSADRKHMLVIGHSEGGMYAILVAETVTPHPAGLALVEPQDERILDLLDTQINEGLDTQVAQGAISDTVAKDNAQRVRQAISAFRAGQKPDTSGMLAPIADLLNSLMVSPTNSNYARSDDAIDAPRTPTCRPPRSRH